MLKTIIHLVTFLLWKFQKGLSLDHHLNRVQPPNSPWFSPVSKCNWFSRRSPGSRRTNLEISLMEHPRRIVVTSAVLIHTTFFFFFPLPHKSDGKKKEILFHLCNRTNYLQAEGMLGDHALCFVGPTCVTGRLCPQEWINLETSTQAAEEAVARGLQEMWEPWRVLVSTPHPSPLDAFL